MASGEDLDVWVIEALKAQGGKASVFDVCKFIWTHREQELRSSERLLYTWQYEVR